ncbi:MAG: ABC transporter substrate-binding protein [Mesorhizobium sp.]|uniref:ABC transporter substrate-binding protein n=1 Tax=unclassified Mesorhizobium TaxID=325217 RepID=UPI000F75FD5C|nr:MULTISPECIES: ABC transporter substrate-binding protein [unclassified Mesorhizobium]RVC76190.1 ABC transporter substrate-binding protein [Mesorhizobium sp. M2A.F.Ca.ET.046.02.1.1]AZO34162.1 ABC transporter substrate-binding protein [Mesorhizobium sp. M2A.F.Ca.ET.046.03.2.1]AZO71590.1 ABC transporter substrate-binding protein [Mesorhizobium sp. M1D.F.Ca.ET.043.01.1.1]RWB49832.1 MAG: ABC transporter substrate-binding protein [Mesorhizobium sp.]RWD00883.1 MAG: ABC transporter substrate-binding
MNKSHRRAVMKAMLAVSAAPWIMRSTAFAASTCGNHTVRMGATVSPDTMNPFATWSSFWPTAFTYDFLVGVDAQRHPDRKGFAKEWSVADDNLTWTFKIWPGMKWSDGQPATARDAAFTYNYLRDSLGTPDELSIGWNNTTGVEQVESITALDDETLQIVTKAPTRWPVANFNMIVPEHIWKDISHADARGKFRNSPPLVGTGPMIVSEFQQGQFARLVPNKYFRAGPPAAAGMVFHFFDTADPIAQSLKSGDIDYGVYLTAAQWADLSEDPAIVVGQQRIEQRIYLAFNTASGDGAGSTKALQDRAFRDAIGYAIDQKTMVDRAFRRHADPGVGLAMPVATDYYSDLGDIRRHFDLAEANRRLDAAGYRDINGDGVREDKDGNSFQLSLITGSGANSVAIPPSAVQLVVGWLGQIGIPVSVTQFDSGALNAKTAAPAKGGGGWDVLVASNWLTPSPQDLLVLGSSKAIGQDNRSYWKNDKFDKLLSEVEHTVDLKKSRELVDQAARLIYTEAPYIILCYPFVLDAYRKDCFEGWGTQDALSMWSYFPLDRVKPL